MWWVGWWRKVSQVARQLAKSHQRVVICSSRTVYIANHLASHVASRMKNHEKLYFKIYFEQIEVF